MNNYRKLPLYFLIFTLKYEFKASTSRSAGSAFDWNRAKSELTNAMAQVKQGVVRELARRGESRA